MNYRHAFHAGNFADALKHALLVRLLRSMQRKETGFVFVDTHAGRGAYDLERAALGDSRAREPEWPGGIGRLWGEAGLPPEVADYVEVVRGYDRYRGNLTPEPRFYPGSPRIAKSLLRAQDRMELWEKHPDEAAALRAEFEGEKRVSLHVADGYGAVRACLPPPERRALVLIDPPFESAGEWEEVSRALDEGIKRFPSGTYAIWYPLSGRVPAGEFLTGLGLGKSPCLSVELTVDPDSPRIRGCGVAVVNPPWRFDEEAGRIADYLAIALGRGQVAQGSVRWWVAK